MFTWGKFYLLCLSFKSKGKLVSDEAQIVQWAILKIAMPGGGGECI